MVSVARHTILRCASRQNKEEKKDTTAKCPNCAKRHHAWSLACSVRKEAALKRQEVAKKRPDFVPAPPGTYVWGRNKSEKASRPPKRKEAAPQPKPEISDNQEFPQVKQVQRNHRKKGSNSTTRSPPDPEDMFFDEGDMSILITAVVTAVAVSLSRTEEEADKAVNVAMTTLKQTVKSIKGRKMEKAKSAQSSPSAQVETPLPSPSQAMPSQAEPSQAMPSQAEPNQADSVPQAESEEAEPAQARPANAQKQPGPRKSQRRKVRATKGSPPPSGSRDSLTAERESSSSEDLTMELSDSDRQPECDNVSDVTIN